jgi:hypothetical protein
MFEDWEDFGLRFGPFGVAFGGAGRVRYRGTEKSHVLLIRIDSEVKKQDIKVRLAKPGLLEIEWPRSQGDEIPVE